MIHVLILLLCSSSYLWNHLRNKIVTTLHRRAARLSEIAIQERKELEDQSMEEQALSNKREQVCQLNSTLFGSRLERERERVCRPVVLKSLSGI